MNWPAYAEYKPQETEWIPPVPSHWTTSRIKFVGSIKYGIGEPPGYVEDGTALIRATNVSEGRIYEKGLVYVNPKDIPSKRIVWLEEGDIIVVRSGAYTGDSGYVSEGYAGAIAGFDMVLRARDAVPAFLQYSLLSEYLKRGQIDIERARAAQPHLNAEELGNCIVVLPPRSEQNCIVAFLDRETAKIDALIAKQEQLIATLREDRAATITQAVTKGLDPNVEMKDSGAAWIGDVPDHWSVAKIKHGFSVTLGKMFQGEAQAADDVQLPHLKAGSVATTGLSLDDPMLCWFSPGEVRSLTLRKGDILVVEGGAIGRCVVLDQDLDDWGFQKSLNRVRSLHGDSPEFLAYLIEAATLSGHVSILCGKATIPHFTAEKLAALEWPHPGVDEQAAIAAFLKARCAEIDALISKSTEMIETLREYRSALITDAVTGRIDVRKVA